MIGFQQESITLVALTKTASPRSILDRGDKIMLFDPAHPSGVCLLTGGDDRSYALGLTAALTVKGVEVDFIGSDKLDAPELRSAPLINFLNLRGDQREDARFRRKVTRILLYYGRLIRYAASARPQSFISSGITSSS